MALVFFSGKTPSSKDELHISVKVTEISCLAIFRNSVGIEQGPSDLVSSRTPIISLSSLGVVGAIKNDSGTLFFRIGGLLVFF